MQNSRRNESSKLRPVPPDANVMRIIHEISRMTHDKITQSCPYIQRSCRLIMMELAHQDNVTQLDLVHATHLKAPTVSVTLQKMEQDGIVSREADKQDLRATRVCLTPKGRDLDRQIISKIREQEGSIENCLTQQELDTLRPLLLKIYNNLIGGDDTREDS